MNTYGHDSLEKALVSAVELATEDLNDRLEYVNNKHSKRI